MKSVSRIALGAALVLTGTSVALVPPALAKKKEKVEQPAKAQFSKEERDAILPLETASNAKDWVAAAAALPAAEAAAKGPDARHLVAARKLNLGIETKNVQMQTEAIDTLISNGKAAPVDLPNLYRNQGILAANARNSPKAEAAYTKLVELAPNDPEALVGLAEAKNSSGKGAEAVATMDRAIQAKRAAGPVEESWYKRGLKLAFDGKMVPESLKLNRQLVEAYPTKVNWREAGLISYQLSKLDADGKIDAFRLIRAAGALGGERDYLELADALNDRKPSLPGEAKAVIDQGVRERMVDPNKRNVQDLLKATGGRVAEDRGTLAASEKKALAAATGGIAVNTADGYLSYGDYAKAATLYRAALQKGSVDANAVNTRLGIALAMAGQKAEAEVAFKAVTGPRADLASLWILWMSQRA